jgi:hypothetical protein
MNGGTHHNGERLDLLYGDFHVAPVLVSTYNDVSDTIEMQQWQYNAP